MQLITLLTGIATFPIDFYGFNTAEASMGFYVTDIQRDTAE